MAEVAVRQYPIFTIADTPFYSGVNDGTAWMSTGDAFVAVQTNASRQDRAGAMNVPTSSELVTAARVAAILNYDSDGTPAVMRWTLAGTGWTLSGTFDLPLPDSIQRSFEWVFVDGDPTVTYGGAFGAGIDYALLTADLAAGDVRLDAYTDTAPTYAQVVVHQFQLFITQGATVRVLRSYPRDDAYGFGSTGRNYPRPSGRRNYGGQP